MVEPPSRRLQQILLGLKLCSPRDLRRCASRVKALSADLPAFDSVWLDALVQRRVLTSWQAQTIEADLPELLKVGPCVVESQIGQSQRAATYLARLPDQQGPCVIKRIVVPTELKKSVTDRLKQLTEKTGGLHLPGLIIPHSVSEVSSEPLPQLAPSEKLKESAATRASRQTSTVSTTKKRNTKAGVSRPRKKNRTAKRDRSSKLNTELAIVSRWADGLSLSEILLRRGRLSTNDVDAIARQLLESLAALHEAGIVHGEILLSNIRLLPSGQTVLVDAGILPALQPEFQINAHVSPEKNDGVAPELIGTGATATIRSDLYALGFALWHLLAGRPAFPTGDPLAKLAAHQTERLPDIREFAPDTPARLARTIEWLTEPVATHRPRNARELLAEGTRSRTSASRKYSEQKKTRSAPTSATVTKNVHKDQTPPIAIKPAGRATRRRLSHFAASFQQPSRRSAQSSSARKTMTSLACACAAILVAITALFTLDARSRNFVVAALPPGFLQTVNSDIPASTEAANDHPGSTSAGSPVESPISDSTSQATAVEPPRKPSTTVEVAETDRAFPDHISQKQQIPVAQPANQLLPLPEPDPYGLILLSEPGTYDAGSVFWPGSHLTIRGATDTPARIVVTTQPLRLRATEVTLENVEVRLAPERTRSTTMSQIRSQKLTCRNCSFLAPLSSENPTATQESDSALSTGLAIQWSPIDASDPLAGELNFQKCRFIGSCSSVILEAPGRKVSCTNTLKIGGGPLFIAAGRAASGDNTFQIEHTTLRDCGSLIAINLQNAPPWKSRLTIKPVSSVFDLRRRKNNQTESLLTFIGGRLQLTWHERVSFEGDDSVAGEAVGLASWQAGNGAGHQEIDAADVSVHGLMQTGFTFRGSADAERTNSILADVQTNRLKSQLPGISNNLQTNTRLLDSDDLLIVPELPSDL